MDGKRASIQPVDKAFQTRHIKDHVNFEDMRDDMADVIDFSSRSVVALDNKDEFRSFGTERERQWHLFLVFRDPSDYLILRYADLESIAPVTGVSPDRAVMLRFGGSVIRDVRIDGERVLELVRHLRWHQVTFIEETPLKWLRGQPRTTVTKITVREVRR